MADAWPVISGSTFPSLDDHDVHDVLADAMLALADSFDASRGSLARLVPVPGPAAGRGPPASGPVAAALGILDAATCEPADVQATPLEELATQERLARGGGSDRSLSTLEQAVVEADLEEGGAASAEDWPARLHTTAGSVYAAAQRARRKLLARCRVDQ